LALNMKNTHRECTLDYHLLSEIITPAKYACLLLLSPLMCQSKAPNNMKKRDNKERSHQMDRIQYKTHQKSIVVSSQTDESHQLIDPVQM